LAQALRHHRAPYRPSAADRPTDHRARTFRMKGESPRTASSGLLALVQLAAHGKARMAASIGQVLACER